jgi:hypothetical protein
VVQQSCLLNGLIARCADEVLDNVACVAARRLANDLTGSDVPAGTSLPGGSGSVLDAAAQLGATKAFGKGSDEGMLARAWGQAAKGNGSSAGDVRLC